MHMQGRVVLVLSMIAALACGGLPRTVDAATPAVASNDQSLLKAAAEAQEAEIALGRMASERAGSEEVKEFGSRMVADHQKVSKELRRLASKRHLRLSKTLSGEHQDKQRAFAQLSGKDFDRAYIAYVLEDHRTDIKELKRHSKRVADAEVTEWIDKAVPLMKSHFKHATAIASSFGLYSPHVPVKG